MTFSSKFMVTPNMESSLFSEHSNLGVALYDPLTLNIVWAKFYGAKEKRVSIEQRIQQVMANPGMMATLLHPEDSKRALLEYIFLLESGKELNNIYRVRIKDNLTYTPVLLRATHISLKDSNGETRSFVLGFFFDLEETILKSDLAATFENEVRKLRAKQWLRGLGDTEIQILRQIGEGYLDKEIAETMHLSVSSIIQYRRKLLRFFDVRSKLDLVRIAFQSGLVS